MSESETRRIGILSPEEPTPAESGKKPRLPDVRVIVLLACVLLLVMLILFLLLFLRLGRKGPGDTFRYGQKAAEFSLNTTQDGVCTAHGDSFAAVTDTGFAMFDVSGKALGFVPDSFRQPLLISGGPFAAVLEIGGNGITAMTEKGSVLLQQETEGTLLDGHAASDGAICYAELQQEYKTVLTVLDKKQNQIYRWYSGSRYLNQCALSEGADVLCAVALGEEETHFQSTAVLFETDEEAPIGEVPLGEQYIWELLYLDGTILCAIGENTTVCFTEKGERLGEYDYGGQTLKNFAADGFTALILNKYQDGNCNTVVTLDQNGEKLGERYLGEEVLDVSVAGGFCAVLTPQQLYVYDKTLNLCATLAQSASQAVIYADGSVVLTDNGICSLYCPEA